MNVSKKKKSKKKSIDLVKMKKKILVEYCKLKKVKRGMKLNKNEMITRLQEFSISEKTLAKCYGDFVSLRVIGDKRYNELLPESHKALLSELSKKFDETATKEDCLNDLRRVAKDFGIGTVSRNFYRQNGKYSDSTWNSLIGTFEEFKRQAGLQLTRHQHKLEREIAKHASHDHYQKFYENEYLPLYRKHKKKESDSMIKTMMVFTDVHDKESDPFTVEVFIAECKRRQPDIIVFGGDIFDMPEFSNYKNDPRDADMQSRFEWVWNKLFGPVREACPDSQIDFLLGNHEMRIIKHLSDVSPNMKVLLSNIMGITLNDVFGVDRFGINLISKFDLTAFSARDMKREIACGYEIYYGCYVVCHEPDQSLTVMDGCNAHHHLALYRSKAVPIPETGKVKNISWIQTPAGHKKSAVYLPNMCKWNTGFVTVIINTEKKEVVQTIQQTHSDWTVIDGVVYKRTEIED